MPVSYMRLHLTGCRSDRVLWARIAAHGDNSANASGRLEVWVNKGKTVQWLFFAHTYPGQKKNEQDQKQYFRGMVRNWKNDGIIPRCAKAKYAGYV